METEINTLSDCLHSFRNRQVVLNFYEDEELIERDGFYFQTMLISKDEIKFFDEEKLKATIPLSSYQTFEPSKDFFRNYYEMVNGTSKLAIYFP